MSFNRYQFLNAFIALSIVMIGFVALPCKAASQELDTETPTTLKGKASQKQTIEPDEPKTSNIESQNDSGIVLKGGVQTIDAAIQTEQASVDWYGWYMRARSYLGATGGVACTIGTPIKFYKGGRIEPQSIDPLCLLSLQGRRFALPKQTQLEAVILPVRSGRGPAASPAEIYQRTQNQRYP